MRIIPGPTVIWVRLSRPSGPVRRLGRDSRGLRWICVRIICDRGQHIGVVQLGRCHAGGGQSEFVGQLGRQDLDIWMVQPVVHLDVHPTTATPPEYTGVSAEQQWPCRSIG
jgi:hypothetical protein